MSRVATRTPATLEEALQELGHARRALDRRDRDLQEFVYLVSHDLRAPLRHISAFTQLLVERLGGRLDEESRSWMDHVAAGAERLSALIDDLIAMSRIDSRAEGIERVPLGVALDQAMQALGEEIDRSGARIEGQGLTEIDADRQQLVQVLIHLLSNAIKFRGEGAPHVRVSARVETGGVAVRVVDQGIGIAPEHQGRVFQPFRRLHPTGCYAGNGIGLSLCKRIVERHEGRIWIESDGPGAGSAISFWLPTDATRPGFDPSAAEPSA